VSTVHEAEVHAPTIGWPGASAAEGAGPTIVQRDAVSPVADSPDPAPANELPVVLRTPSAPRFATEATAGPAADPGSPAPSPADAVAPTVGSRPPAPLLVSRTATGSVTGASPAPPGAPAVARPDLRLAPTSGASARPTESDRSGPSASGATAADPGSVAVALGLATREPDGSVVFVQRAEAPETTSPAAPATTTTPASGEGGAPATGGAPAGPGGAPTADLDELARQLYDRIRWRLRSELRLDLERSGLGAGLSR
jgi:hypothetical protein